MNTPVAGALGPGLIAVVTLTATLFSSARAAIPTAKLSHILAATWLFLFCFRLFFLVPDQARSSQAARSKYSYNQINIDTAGRSGYVQSLSETFESPQHSWFSGG